MPSSSRAARNASGASPVGRGLLAAVGDDWVNQPGKVFVPAIATGLSKIT